MAKNPSTVTIYGRLSFPNFLYQQAVKRNQTSQFPKADVADVTPDFNLLVEQAQLDKLKNHVLTEFLPFILEKGNKGERGGLDQSQVDRLVKALEAEDWDVQPPYLPIKPVADKTAALAPEAVASIKIVGNKGTDIDLKAIVESEDQLLVPDPDQLKFPVIKPIQQTVHQMYGGCYVAATLNLYAYVSGKLPGFSASAGTAVFKADGERFGGGTAVDEDEIFAD